jgi:hypothetical protein
MSGWMIDSGIGVSLLPLRICFGRPNDAPHSCAGHVDAAERSGIDHQLLGHTNPFGRRRSTPKVVGGSCPSENPRTRW